MFSIVRASTAAVVLVATALSFTTSANAQNSEPQCVYASWASNGDSQNPCQIWATLGSKCGTFSVPALGPASNGTSAGYPVPSSSGAVPANDCQCNLVAYSLMAACSWCQDGVYSDSWATIAQWKANCPTFNTNGVQSSVNTTGINVPPYAVQAIDGPWWDPTNAQAAQVALGSSGTANSTTGTRNGAVGNSARGLLPLVALAPLYMLL